MALLPSQRRTELMIRSNSKWLPDIISLIISSRHSNHLPFCSLEFDVVPRPKFTTPLGIPLEPRSHRLRRSIRPFPPSTPEHPNNYLWSNRGEGTQAGNKVLAELLERTKSTFDFEYPNRLRMDRKSDRSNGNITPAYKCQRSGWLSSWSARYTFRPNLRSNIPFIRRNTIDAQELLGTPKLGVPIWKAAFQEAPFRVAKWSCENVIQNTLATSHWWLVSLQSFSF